ncbi:MAG: rRNA maturation RNase YbeY [Bacteroidota bacterium]|nr:rRNA maturation RNase YbeY [Bacteroidota bacterium]
MIKINVFNDHPQNKIQRNGTIRSARYVLRSESVLSAEINIIFTTDKIMKKLNAAFLNHWYTTDVISFPLGYDNKKIEGEVYINLDKARRQAKELYVSIKEEYTRLVIHGILHLSGYKDNTRDERERMTTRENLYLTKILNR